MDNTAWMAGSKEDLQKIIDIANKFYKISDTKINGSKSKILVLNANKNERFQPIVAGSERAKVFPAKFKETVRYLDVYSSEERQDENIMKLIEKEIHTVINILMRKKLTDLQSTYIINKVLIP